MVMMVMSNDHVVIDGMVTLELLNTLYVVISYYVDNLIVMRMMRMMIV